MREAFFGAGFHDFILRFYTFHVFMLPIALLGLMVVHFPRFMVFDVPMVMAISGAIMLTGGVFPVGLGLPFTPTTPPGLTVPEWYLTGLYAFLRTMFRQIYHGRRLARVIHIFTTDYSIYRQVQEILLEG